MVRVMSRGAANLAAVLSLVSLHGCGSSDSKGSSTDDGGATGDGAADAATTFTATFTSADCADVLLPADTTDAECGWATVPADHAKPGADTIQLAVAVLKAAGTKVDDPIVFLGGGPGSEVIKHYLGQYAGEVVPLWRATRDVVFFDQRGTGVSKPGLDCKEYDDQYLENLGQVLTAEEETTKLYAANQKCHDRLVAEGVDLTLFTNAQNAQDVRDVVTALGYSSYNLYGISYGTRLAQTVLRDAPAGVRSVILDSAFGLEANQLFPKDAQYAFKALFAACTADAKCAAAFPNLEQTLSDTVTRLETTPLSVPIPNPTDGQPAAVMVTGTRYLYGLQQAMYTTATIPALPSVIAQTAQGNTALLASAAAGSAARNDSSEGMSYSINCADEDPFGRPLHDANMADVTAPYDMLDRYSSGPNVCDIWGARAADPLENEPVKSDLPTLILAGSLDPILPPYYDEQIHQNLSNSQYLLFPGFGHGIVRAKSGEAAAPRCAQKISQAFFDDPTKAVDSSCLADIPPVVWAGAN